MVAVSSSSSRREKSCIAFGLAVLLPGAFAVSVFVPSMPASVLATRGDALLPLVPEAVWIYLSWYAAVLGLLLLDHATFRRAWIALAIAFSVAMAGYILVPVEMNRPEVVGESASAIALRLLYRLDPPRNVFPSFHAAVAVIIACCNRSRIASTVLGIWSGAVCAACVLTKQHFLVDVVAGVVIGMAAWSTSGIVARRSDARPFERDLPWREMWSQREKWGLRS